MKEIVQLTSNVEALGRFFKLRRSNLVHDSRDLLSSIEQAFSQLAEQKKVLEVLHAKDSERITELRMSLEGEKSRIAESEARVAAFKQQVSDVSEQLKVSEKQFHDAKLSIEQLQASEAELSDHLVDMQGELAEFKEQLAKDAEEFKRQIEKLSQENSSLVEAKEVISSELICANKQIEQQQQKEAQLLIDLEQSENALIDLQRDHAKQSHDVTELTIKLQEQSERAEQAEILELLLADNTAPLPAIESFSKLLEHDFIALANKENSLPEEALAYKELQAILQELTLVANFAGIKDKAMVVLSGGFSSGKSQFLNSLAKGYKKGSKQEYLKVGTTPTTAVPTYVQSSAECSSKDVTAYSSKGVAVTLTGAQFHKLTHNYINQLSFDIRSVMPYASISYPMRIDNTSDLSFVDTPGIDSSSTGSTGNDKTTAEQFIQQANALLWFVSIKSSGTIGEDDLRFLSAVQGEHPDLPIYIVANQADTSTEDEIEDKLDQFEDVLADNHIRYEGLSAYSGFTGMEYEHRGPALFDFLAQCNKAHNLEMELGQRLSEVFGRYYQAFSKDIAKGRSLKKAFEGITLSILAETGDIDLQEKMQPEIDKISEELAVTGLETLNNEFKALHQKMANCIAQVFGNDYFPIAEEKSATKPVCQPHVEPVDNKLLTYQRATEGDYCQSTQVSKQKFNQIQNLIRVLAAYSRLEES